MSNTKEWIESNINTSANTIKDINKHCIDDIIAAADTIIHAIKCNNKIFWCGNGGSAAQAQHLSCELVCGLRSHNRPALASIALTTDTSLITAWSNDVDYNTVFSRQIEALGHPGDILIAFSTSGNSKNVINAIKTAKKNNIIIVGLTGNSISQIIKYSDIKISIPSNDTQRIQEGHILVGHIICEIVENYFIQNYSN